MKRQTTATKVLDAATRAALAEIIEANGLVHTERDWHVSHVTLTRAIRGEPVKPATSFFIRALIRKERAR